MKLSLKEKIAYGIGAVGKDIVYMFTASYILYYFENCLGISAIFTGMLLLGARVFDAFNDPLMGVLVARTRSPWGKFRPWILSGTVLNAAVLIFMFAAPASLDQKGLMIWAAVTYVLWGVTYTMMDIPFWSMIPAFTSDPKEREGLSTLGRTCAGAGSAIASVLTMMMVMMLGKGDERLGFKLFAIIVAVVFVLSAIFLFVTIQEKSTVDVETVSVKEMFKALIGNDQAMVLVVTIVLVNVSIYITSNLVIYYFKYDFGGANWSDAYTLFNTFGGATQILSMMLLYPLVRKFLSMKQVFNLCVQMAMCGFVVLLILSMVNLKNLYVLFIPGFLIFAANGMITVLTTVFLADSVDYGQMKNGRRDESVIFSMQTFVVKLASGVAALLAALCLEIFHISDSTEAVAQVSNGSLIGLRLTMTLLPLAGLMVALYYFKTKYLLDEEKMAQIHDALGGVQS